MVKKADRQVNRLYFLTANDKVTNVLVCLNIREGEGYFASLFLSGFGWSKWLSSIEVANNQKISPANRRLIIKNIWGIFDMERK